MLIKSPGAINYMLVMQKFLKNIAIFLLTTKGQTSDVEKLINKVKSEVQTKTSYLELRLRL